jgi:hypothetical protein
MHLGRPTLVLTEAIKIAAINFNKAHKDSDPKQDGWLASLLALPMAQ